MTVGLLRRPTTLAAAALSALLAFALTTTLALAQIPRVITLQSPAPGAVVTAPVEVRGRVTVGPFENNLRGRIYDAAGRVIGQGPVNVILDDPLTLGGPGSFHATIPLLTPAGGPARVEIADVSARDGSVIASASVNVTLGGPSATLPRTGAQSVTDYVTGIALATGFAAIALIGALVTLRLRRHRTA